MASPTLITFFLWVLIRLFPRFTVLTDRCHSLLPRHAKRVELFGSWDNFRTPYAMRRDKDVGPTHWRGCFAFSGIVCDGADLLGALTARDGPLLMGGTYWYFYRLDDETEYCDPHRPSTTACPLLPGQYLNRLDVPAEWAAHGPSSSGRSAPELEASVFTLDPEDKFRTKPKPPQASTAAGQSRKVPPGKAGASRGSESMLDAGALSRDLLRLKKHGFGDCFRDEEADEADRRRSLPPSRRESLRSTFRRLRPNRSVHLPRNHWQTVESSVTGLPVSGPSLELDGVPPYYTSVTSDVAELPGSVPPNGEPNACPEPTNKSAESPRVFSEGPMPRGAPTAIVNGSAKSRKSLVGKSGDSPSAAPLRSHGTGTIKKTLSLRTRIEGNSWLHLDQLSQSPADASLETDFQRLSIQHEGGIGSSGTPPPKARKHLSLASSNRTSGVFSLDSSQADADMEPSSPAPRDSQPITPTLDSAFDAAPLVYARPTAYNIAHPNSVYESDAKVGSLKPDDPLVLAWRRQQQQQAQQQHESSAWPAYAADHAFLGYSLPAEQHASEQTLRPPHSEGKLRPATPGVVQGPDSSASNRNGRSALDELVEDMGYLGALIA